MTTSAKSLPFCALILAFISYSAHSATFNILNQCGYTVWPAASIGGGRRLEPGQSWSLFVPAGTSAATIWGRTGCIFDGSGSGVCQTGDCGGGLNCQAPSSGRAPLTLAEFTLNGFRNLDFYDISVIDGFNIPMEFSPMTGGCTNLRCLNRQCPDAYQFPADSTKSKSCQAGGDFTVVFCPGSIQCFKGAKKKNEAY